MIDTLTNIPNKEQLEADLKEFKHPKLFLLDIKDFKELNISYSDEAGDIVLQKFAAALQSFAQFHEMSYYRIKNDEFALVKNIPFELSVLENLISNICKFTDLQKYQYKSNTLNINFHIGICIDHFKTLEKAYSALNLAKQQDQAFVTYSQFAIDLLNESKDEVFKIIKKAIQDKKILPYFQSVIDVDENIFYKEALIRIEAQDGIQTPKFFLKIAHEKGVYATIIKEISHLLCTIKEKKGINLSFNDFEDEDLFHFLIDIYKDSNTVFELHHGKYLEDSKIIEKIKLIKQNNIQICIDNVKDVCEIDFLDKDFVDYIKVNGDIIRLLPLHDKEYEMCSKILEKAKAFNAKTIAAHINSKSSFTTAAEMEFDYFQGFLFGKPSIEF